MIEPTLLMGEVSAYSYGTLAWACMKPTCLVMTGTGLLDTLVN